MTAYLCDISTGQVYDNLSIKDDGTPGDPDKVALSYNQGTFMAAALELYNATGEDEYLRNAVAFGSYQVNKKMDSNYPVFSGDSRLTAFIRKRPRISLSLHCAAVLMCFGRWLIPKAIMCGSTIGQKHRPSVIVTTGKIA